MDRSLIRFLRRRGATDEEIRRAAEHDYLTLLVLDRAILPGARQYTLEEAAARAGIDVDTTRVLWRAIGFPDLPSDARMLTERDVDALKTFVLQLRNPWFGDFDLERALPQARVLSSSLARLADSESDEVARSVDGARGAGISDEELASTLSRSFQYERIAQLLDHVHRLQLRAAIWRKVVGAEPGTPGTVEVAVGFVDLVGYTALAEDLDDEALSSLIERFTEIAHDTVVAAGGRIVKTIGDEVMFITDDPGTATSIALSLAEASTQDELLPDAHAGVAFGTVLSREGDYYGAVVNLASRLTELALPGTVLVSGEIATTLIDDARFSLRRLSRRRVRGIGRIDIYRVEVASREARRG